jgi:hypothetical protein
MLVSLEYEVVYVYSTDKPNFFSPAANKSLVLTDLISGLLSIVPIFDLSPL